MGIKKDKREVGNVTYILAIIGISTAIGLGLSHFPFVMNFIEKLARGN